MSKGTQLHILKVDISHGSDRHEISMYSVTPPTVGMLVDELERKTRVPASRIQIIFKGQKIHFNPQAPLAQFGIFTGSKLLMVGERFNPTQDAIFRRVLGIAKDVGLIEKTIKESSEEFQLMKNGGMDRSMINEYLPQLHQRVCGFKKDLETFMRVLTELDVNQTEMPDVKKHQDNTRHYLKSYIKNCDSLINEISILLKNK